MIDDKTYRRLCTDLRNNDAACIGEIYDVYGDALFGVVMRITKDEDVAAELLHDTFVKAWQKGHTFNPDVGRLFTWLMRIARNLSINYINSKAAKNSRNIRSDENLVYLGDDSKTSDAMENFDLRGAVTGLEEKYRIIIDLTYFQGYTHKEASDELNLPIGTVKSRIKIGLRELKKIYNYRLTSIAISMILLFTMSL